MAIDTTLSVLTNKKLQATTINRDILYETVLNVSFSANDPWQDALTITPADKNDAWGRGMIEVVGMGRTDTKGNGVRITRWGMEINGTLNVITTDKIGTDVVSGSTGAPEIQTVISSSGNDYKVQVRSGNAGAHDFLGMLYIKVYAPSAMKQSKEPTETWSFS